jgi:DNA gyrase subunit A
LKVHEIPHAGRAAKGRAIVNLLEKPREESITSVLMVKDFTQTKHVMMATRLGVIKKVSLEQFSRPRRAGIRAIDLKDNDSLIDVHLTDGEHEIIVATREGKAVRFKESDVRQMGRTAAGVRSVTLAGPDDYVIGMVTTPSEEHSLLVLAEKGYGKRSKVKDYRLTKRGTKGVLTIKVSEKTGPLVGIKLVTDNHDLMIITSKGVLIRQPIEQIRVMGRATQGVRLIRMDEGDAIGDLAVVQLDDSEKLDAEMETAPEETTTETTADTSNTPESDPPSNGDDEDQGELFNS